MATDAQILTVARDVAAATKAFKDADAAVVDADRKHKAAIDAREAVKVRLSQAKTRLEQLAMQPPAEPAPKPGLVELPVQPIWATEPPKNMADGMANLSDADAPLPKPTPVEPAPVTPPAVPQRRRAKVGA